MSISIHALLAESDFTLLGTPDTWTISIHALLAESDPRSPKISILPCQFLSTLSLRRATLRPTHGAAGNVYFYPRSPCGERQDNGACATDPKGFLSTLSLRRATLYVNMPCAFDIISIHALLAESDRMAASTIFPG